MEKEKGIWSEFAEEELENNMPVSYTHLTLQTNREV